MSHLILFLIRIIGTRAFWRWITRHCVRLSNRAVPSSPAGEHLDLLPVKVEAHFLGCLPRKGPLLPSPSHSAAITESYSAQCVVTDWYTTVRIASKRNHEQKLNRSEKVATTTSSTSRRLVQSMHPRRTNVAQSMHRNPRKVTPPTEKVATAPQAKRKVRPPPILLALPNKKTRTPHSKTATTAIRRRERTVDSSPFQM